MRCVGSGGSRARSPCLEAPPARRGRTPGRITQGCARPSASAASSRAREHRGATPLRGHGQRQAAAPARRQGGEFSRLPPEPPAASGMAVAIQPRTASPFSAWRDGRPVPRIRPLAVRGRCPRRCGGCHGVAAHQRRGWKGMRVRTEKLLGDDVFLHLLLPVDREDAAVQSSAPLRAGASASAGAVHRAELRARVSPTTSSALGDVLEVTLVQSC